MAADAFGEVAAKEENVAKDQIEALRIQFEKLVAAMSQSRRDVPAVPDSDEDQLKFGSSPPRSCRRRDARTGLGLNQLGVAHPAHLNPLIGTALVPAVRFCAWVVSL